MAEDGNRTNHRVIHWLSLGLALSWLFEPLEQGSPKWKQKDAVLNEFFK